MAGAGRLPSSKAYNAGAALWTEDTENMVPPASSLTAVVGGRECGIVAARVARMHESKCGDSAAPNFNVDSSRGQKSEFVRPLC
jgi:hypothetical protein